MGLVKQVNQGNVALLQGATGCCPDAAEAICKHVFIIEALESITSITIDGNVHALNITDETALGDIVTAIEAAFEAEGYLPTNDKEMIPNISIYIDDDGFHNILIYTNAATVVLTTVPVVDDTYISCEKTVVCRYHAEIPVGAGLSFEISDSDVEAADPGNSPQTINGDFPTGQEVTLSTEVSDAFVDLYAGTDNATVKRVRVIENAAGTFYGVDVWLYGRHPNLVTNNEDITFELCECTVDYTIAN